jgi:golgi to ER traffic protein 4
VVPSSPPFYADEIEDEVYSAEKHLLLGTKSSPPILAKLLYDYFLENSPHTAGIYISRAVLPYLCLQNLRDAQVSLSTFTTLLISGENVPPHSMIEGTLIFPALPQVNFLGLLIVACQRGAPEFFNGLKTQYSQTLEEVPWNDVLYPTPNWWRDECTDFVGSCEDWRGLV